MDKIERAFIKYPRHQFVPEDLWDQSYLDIALPIGYGQTISQPSTIRLMLEWLDVTPGQTILDIGSGSGWSTALLSYLTGSKGRVVGLEKIAELKDFGKNNNLKMGIKNTEFYLAGKSLGIPDKKFNRILVSAAAKELPKELLEQLEPMGKMVIPIKNDIYEIHNLGSKNEIYIHNGFAFVPLL